MKLGVTFPQTEIGGDVVAVRDFVQAVEEMGFDLLTAYDHVLGAAPDRPDRLTGPYTDKHSFHEPFVLFGYAAAITQRLELITHVLILPQRQTALVAKQAAEVDVLSGGRLRLGVGIGWNHVEYESLGVPFRQRGRQLDEQVALLRAFWTEEIVDFQGQEHRVDRAGLNPMPVQRPIPIWFGGSAEGVLRRTGRVGAGWMPNVTRFEQMHELRGRIDSYAREAGRDPREIAMLGGTRVAGQTPEDWAQRLVDLQANGYTHASFVTMDAGLKTVDEHIAAVRRFKETAAGVL